jgi:hypothetical protein
VGLINPSLPIVGQPNSSEEPKIVTFESQLLALVNGNLDDANIAPAGLSAASLALTEQQKLGLNDGAQVGRGKSIIATTESRSNVAYGTLTTPDQVSGLVLPTDGLIVVTYQATWQESVNGAARAAIFVGATQLKLADSTAAAPVVQEASLACGTANIDKPLSSHTAGLSGPIGAPNATVYSGDVTTGQLVGLTGAGGASGAVSVFAAAGTYTVSVQFKSTSGSVTAKNRKLWVWTIGF